MVIVSQLLLYITLALLMGVMLGNSLLAGHMPKFHVPKWLVITAVGGVILFASAPSLEIIMNLSGGMDVWTAATMVLLEFNIGNAWLFTYFIGIVFVVLIAFNDLGEDRIVSGAGMVIVILMAIAQGLSSHAFEQASFWGVTVHSVHLLAVMVWGGMLIILGWFTKVQADWPRILSWFTPLALISMLVLAVSGVFTMDVVTANPDGEQINIVQRFTDAWLTDYGQSLLFKHLLLITLLGFGTINGILFRKRLAREPKLQIQPWIKTESFLILLVLAITGFMGEQALPNQIETIVSEEGTSSLFQSIYGQAVPPEMMVSLSFGFISILLFILAALFFGCMLYAARSRMHPAASFIMAICFVLAGYLGLMLGVV
ncbi:copper resistance D family protein [Salinicoccus albus]|uniref:copper resistance D family protein n=1 Tax=Salinicoccus albus TaxID=418756 RepID=UPI0003629EF7|nr:CopD family protein [Salinicoccus albus]